MIFRRQKVNGDRSFRLSGELQVARGCLASKTLNRGDAPPAAEGELLGREGGGKGGREGQKGGREGGREHREKTGTATFFQKGAMSLPGIESKGNF